MAKNRMILVAIACFSAVLLAAQASSFASRKFPPKRGMTKEEHRKEIEQVNREANQQRLKTLQKRMDARLPQAWKGLLRISERQWKIIEPKIDKIQVVGSSMWACAPGYRGGDAQQSFHWYKHSEGTPHRSAKAPHEMSEGEKLADELVDLLENENSKDEEIRKKIDQLQQVREKARKELAEIRRELAALPMTPRQEAIFLVMGYID